MLNQIHRCQNCNYPLVLIERRRRYKCAKCSKLWNQKEVEDNSFKEFNIKKRQELKKDTYKVYKRDYNREYSRKGYSKEYYERNKEKLRVYNRERYRKRKGLTQQDLEKKKISQKEWIENNREEHNERIRTYYHKDVSYQSHLNKMRYWRRQQVKLALIQLKVNLNK